MAGETKLKEQLEALWNDPTVRSALGPVLWKKPGGGFGKHVESPQLAWLPTERKGRVPKRKMKP